MLEKIHLKNILIENYRNLRTLSADKFGQVNLITGDNNSGKTTLLEALFLCLGPTNPSLWTNVNARRGISRISPQQNTVDYLFYRRDTSKPVKFTVKTSNGLEYELAISLVEPTEYEISASLTLPEPSDDKSFLTIEDLERSVIVRLTFTSKNEQPKTTDLVISPGKMNARGETKPTFPTSTFVSDRCDENTQTQQAERYSTLDKSDEGTAAFNQLLKTINPEIRRTSLAIENGLTLIHADIGFGLIPLSLTGSSSRRLTDILLALSNSPNGIVLIDEIENSFHHSKLEKVWLAIAQFAEEYKCQVFATTHSDENIKAALEVFKKSRTLDFKLHRLDTTADKSELFTFETSQIEAALETGWEVR